MTYPTAAVVTTNLDAGTDSPASARTDLFDAVQKLNQMIAHTSAFAAALLDDASASAARATLGSGATGDALFVAATVAEARSILGAAASGANSDITSLVALAAGGLPDGSVLTDDIANLAVTGAKIAANTLTPDKLTGGQSGSAAAFAIRAWCVFDGTVAGTNAPTAGGGVTSVTRNSGGNYTVNFSTAMPSANYSVAVFGGYTSGPTGFKHTDSSANTTSACQIIAFNTTSASGMDVSRIYVLILG